MGMTSLGTLTGTRVCGLITYRPLEHAVLDRSVDLPADPGALERLQRDVRGRLPAELPDAWLPR
jgi:hypothetical protein